MHYILCHMMSEHECQMFHTYHVASNPVFFLINSI